MAAAAACKKEGGAGGGGGGAGGGGDDLNVVPADSDIVGSIDLAKLRSSAAFKELGKKMMDQATQELAKFKDKCGFDPVETMKSVSFGMKMLDDRGKMRGSVVVHTSAPKDQIKACLEKAKPDAEAEGTKINIDGDIAYITPKDGDGFVALTFLGSDGVVALVNDSEWDKGKVTAALAGGGSIKGSKDFTDLHGTVKKGQTMWAYINGSSKIAEQAKAVNLSATGYIASVNVSDGLSAEVRARMKSEEEAKSTLAALKGQLEAAQMFGPKLEGSTDGKDFRVTAEISAGQLKAFAGQVMRGMVGGGDGGDEQAVPVEPAAPAPEAAPAPPAQ